MGMGGAAGALALRTGGLVWRLPARRGVGVVINPVGRRRRHWTQGRHAAGRRASSWRGSHRLADVIHPVDALRAARRRGRPWGRRWDGHTRLPSHLGGGARPGRDGRGNGRSRDGPSRAGSDIGTVEVVSGGSWCRYLKGQRQRLGVWRVCWARRARKRVRRVYLYGGVDLFLVPPASQRG